MDIKVNVNTDGLFAMLDGVIKQFPFAASLALNKVANAAVEAERKGIKERFHIRRAWVLQGIQIIKRADKSSLNVIIGVLKDRDFLNYAEAGTSNRTAMGGMYQWVPNQQYFNNKIIMPTNPLHPSNMAFVKGRGPLNTSLIQNNGHPLVLQRVSNVTAKGRTRKGKSQIGRNKDTGNRVLYFLIKRTKVPAKLKFIETITTTVNEQWVASMQEAVTKALSTAK